VVVDGGRDGEDGKMKNGGEEKRREKKKRWKIDVGEGGREMMEGGRRRRMTDEASEVGSEGKSVGD
jgi:hypothetical protein